MKAADRKTARVMVRFTGREYRAVVAAAWRERTDKSSFIHDAALRAAKGEGRRQ